MTEALSIRVEKEQKRFLRTLAFEKSTPEAPVTVADVVRQLIDQKMQDEKSKKGTEPSKN